MKEWHVFFVTCFECLEYTVDVWARIGPVTGDIPSAISTLEHVCLVYLDSVFTGSPVTDGKVRLTDGKVRLTVRKG